MAASTHLMVMLFLSGIFLTTANAAKILFVAQLFGKSHFNVFVPIIEGLAVRNHDITLQSFFPLPTNHSNVKWMQLTLPERDDSQFMIDLEAEVSKGVVESVRFWIPLFVQACEQFVMHDTTQTLLKLGKQFDVVIVDALYPECASVVASLIGRHTVLLFTSALFPWAPTRVPTPPSYVPNIVAPLTTRMTFFQRLKNAYFAFGMSMTHEFEIVPAIQEITSKLLPHAPTVKEAEKRIVFYVTNADPVMFGPRPLMPHVAHCGGMHCGKTNPLPKDLQDFIESSGNDGFIIFGLGSAVTAAMLKPEFTRSFTSAFGKLKQKVIWKFDKELENLPANVKTVKWMPQQDLLGHPKARLFITHSGLLSLQEAIYHGVPVIPIPLFAEQPGNAARVKEIRIGEPLNFLDVTADSVYERVTEVLNDKSYYENIKRYSKIFKDQPEKPVDRAVFWIEYIVRHDGATHLRSAGEDLNFFQYFLLDVAAFVLVILMTVVGIILYGCRLGIKTLRSKKRMQNTNGKKTN